MTWHWRPMASDEGELRYVDREVFATQSYPQARCVTCRWKVSCRALLDDTGSWAENYWLVRDPAPTSSDPFRLIDRCARSYCEGLPPADVKALRHALNSTLALYAEAEGPPRRHRAAGAGKSLPAPHDVVKIGR